MEPALLVAAAFERETDKVQVPAWRDGAAGEMLQIRMAHLMGERYFDYELYKSDKQGKAFKSAADWVACRADVTLWPCAEVVNIWPGNLQVCAV